jgi:hypothetical protein
MLKALTISHLLMQAALTLLDDYGMLSFLEFIEKNKIKNKNIIN